MEKQAFEPSRKYNIKALIEVAEGGIVSKQLFKNKVGNVSLFAFDAGQGLSEHTAPFDAIVQILEGRAEVSIDGISQELKEGELVLMPANIPHALSAPEPFKMCLTMLRG